MPRSKLSTAIILPAYNEAQVIVSTIKDIKKVLRQQSLIKSKIIVIDDGSQDSTLKLAKNHADVVIHHPLNRGLGAALATGLEYVKRHPEIKYAVSFDSDGQHHPQDILKAIKALNRGFDIVIGSRFLNPKNKIPFTRKLVLKLSNLLTFIFFGLWTSDSQSGFRAFNRKAIEAIKLSTNRMEVSSEFFSEIKARKLKFTEIPISVKYTSYSISKGQSNLNSFNILVKLIYKLFK